MAHVLRFTNGLRLPALFAYEDYVPDDGSGEYRERYVVVDDVGLAGPHRTPRATEFNVSRGQAWRRATARTVVEFYLSGEGSRTSEAGLVRRHLPLGPILRPTYVSRP